jgi:malate synthase
MTIAGLQVDGELAALVRNECLPGTGITEAAFWASARFMIDEFSPRIAAALQRRRTLQGAIDDYHRRHPGDVDLQAYEAVLRQIGYLVDEPADVTIETTGVDAEIADIPGPQLVVPLLNARFAVNAVNARWGSLYDALYGTDAVSVGDRAAAARYCPERGAEVIRRARKFLDQAAPLTFGSHADALGRNSSASSDPT